MTKDSLPKLLYRGLVLPAGVSAAYLVSPFHSKLRSSLRAREGWRKRWLEKTSNLNGSPIWFHVASVGEYEQARPVIDEIKRNFPDVPVIVTFLSPSGMKYAQKKQDIFSKGKGFCEYLPLDFARNAEFCLVSAKPRLLVFVKFDLWPNLIWKAKEMGIPSIVIDATLSESSRRLFPLGRWFYRHIYTDITRILAISEIDAERFRQSVPGHQGIEKMGDTRFDRVWERKEKSGAIDIRFGGRKVIIAGSTWPQDEEKILPALARILKMNDQVSIILAPHEPKRNRLVSLTAWAESHSFSCVLLSSARKEVRERAVIVDSVGVLAELYRLADLAYIGGSFSTGVHSVIEPAAMAIPVLFGPVHANSLEALELSRKEAAFEVRNSKEAFERMSELLQDSAKRTAMGKRAGEYVQAKLGATEKCMVVISGVLNRKSKLKRSLN